MTPLSCPPGLPLLLLRARPFHHIWVFCLAGGVTVILEGQAWFWTSKREHFQYGKALLACKKDNGNISISDTTLRLKKKKKKKKKRLLSP